MIDSTNPIVHHPPAYCTDCKLLFPATDFLMSNSIGTTLRGNLQSCPRCGRPASVLDGTYDAINDKLNIFLASTVSPEARAAVIHLIEQVQANKIALAEAKARAEKIDRRLGGLFDLASWSDQARAQFFGLIIAAGVTAGATLVAGALNAIATHYAPPPTVIVQAPGAQQPDLRERLLSGTVHTPITKQAPPGLKVPRQREGLHSHGHAGAQARAKNDARQKRPDRSQ